MEQWKDIKGFEGIYQISSLARVKSLSRKINNGNGFRNTEEFITKQYDNGHGYLRVCLSKNGKRRFTLVHKMIAQHFLPNPNNLPIVNHKDGNKQNNSIENLEWCTSSWNNQHGFDNRLIVAKKGENHPKAKLSEASVIEIKKLLDKGELTQKEIGEIYKVNSRTINSINKKTTWKHL